MTLKVIGQSLLRFCSHKTFEKLGDRDLTSKTDVLGISYSSHGPVHDPAKSVHIPAWTRAFWKYSLVGDG